MHGSLDHRCGDDVDFPSVLCSGMHSVALMIPDQLGRAVGLPDVFLTDGGHGGGGVIQGTASEGTLVALLAARTKALKHMRRESPAGVGDDELLGRMTLYTSDQEGGGGGDKGGWQLGDNARYNRQGYAVDAAELSEAMRKDREAGLTPMFVCANVGSTNTCAVDSLVELGDACRR
ncbi:unnamed protein product, partial [Scytosiphon promiscuus]